MTLPATQSHSFKWVLRFSTYRDKFRLFRMKWQRSGAAKSNPYFVMLSVALRAKLWRYWRDHDEIAVTFLFVRVHVVSFY